MSNGKRPGGLTALAIIHLVFGALGILGLVMFAGLIALMSSGVMDDMMEEAAKDAAAPAEAPAEEGGPPPGEAAEPGEAPQPEEPEEPPEVAEFRRMWEGEARTALIASLFLSLVATILQIVSGVGYLGQKRVLGRHVGNAYGILSLIGVGVSLAVQQPGTSQWMVLTNLVLPVITLVLINTTFKDDLVH